MTTAHGDTAGPECEPGADAPPRVSFRTAVLYWLRLGFISFGGPAGQISIMHGELVEKRRWISERRFLHALNYTMVLPGPEAQQLATYIGWLLHGSLGGIVAGVLFVLPSLAILVALSWAYLAFGDVPAVAGALWGIKPAVTAIVVLAALRLGSRALASPALKIIALLAFLAIAVLRAPFPYVVLGAGLAGLVGFRLVPAWFMMDAHALRSSPPGGRALIDDDTPVPAHARMRWSRLAGFLLAGLAAWALALALLAMRFGWDGAFTQMAWFFTKAALVTFGGAYAVLPYVYQGAVGHFGWLTGPQMIDGLALGETTPGPLIMIVAFVGFVGGWSQQALGPDALLSAAVMGATVATAFTFLPSFLFILIGGPLVEATRHSARFTAPLAGITAAAVGVILSLGLFFAGHVLWPQGVNGRFDWAAALLGIAAFAMMRFLGTGIVTVVFSCAVAGIAHRLLVTTLD